MPALPPVPKVIKVRLIGNSSNDSDVGTGFDISYSGSAPSIAELNTFAAAIGTAWNSTLGALADVNFTMTTCEVADLTSSTAFTGSATFSHAGTATGATLPLSVAATVDYLVNLRRRGGHWHGQWRLGTQSSVSTSQVWSTTFTGNLVAEMTAFIVDVVAATWSGAGTLAHVAVGYYGPPNRTITSSTGRVRTVSTLLAVPDVFPVVGYRAFTRFGSQRRRLGKSGT